MEVGEEDKRKEKSRKDQLRIGSGSFKLPRNVVWCAKASQHAPRLVEVQYVS